MGQLRQGRQKQKNQKARIDVSQSLGRSPTGDCTSPCVTPHLRCYQTKRRRLMLGIEGIHLQGIYLKNEEAIQDQFEQPCLMNLAGNAFATVCCAATVLATIASLSSSQPAKSQVH